MEHAASNDTTNEVMNTVQYNLTNVKAFVQNRSKSFWIVTGVAMLLLIVWSIYEWWRVSRLWVRYINCPGCYIRFRNVISDCSDKRPINRQRLTKPQNGYTYSMWLYVVDWYNTKSFGKWKSIYYRGAMLDSKNKNCAVAWDSISPQQPGVWLSATHNNIRVAITTTATLPEGCLSGSGGTSTTSSYGQCGAKTFDVNMKNMNLLEYADIENFPIGEWFQLLFVVNNKRLELYLNGKLVSTTVFVGTFRSLCDKENGYFASTGNTFKGRILNFRYMPHALPYQMVKRLYEYELKNPLLKYRDPMDELDNSIE